MPKIIKNGKEYCSTSSLGHASEILYDNSETEMTSTSVQSAITEIKNDVDTFEENLNTLIHDFLSPTDNIIPENSDLNDYTDIGVYMSISEAHSKTLVNCPYTSGGFRLVVSKTTSVSSNYVRQTLETSANNARTYIRNYSPSSGWQDWQCYSDDIDKLDDALANYLPLAGGTMSGGNFYLNGGLGRVLSDANQTQIEHYGTAKDTKDRTLLRIMDSEDIKTALRLIKYDNSTSGNSAYVYHSKNITAGTTAYTAGTTALETNCIHLVYS